MKATTRETQPSKMVKAVGKAHMKRPQRIRSARAERAIIRSGSSTGTTAHFAAWKAEGRVKSILQRMKTVKLADSIEQQSVATPFALLALGGYKDVWQISQATTEDLLAVRHLGISRLGSVEDYLLSKGVKLNWTVK